VGRKGCFRYLDSDGRVAHRDNIARIDALRIPPAWTNVAVNSAPGGMLQAAGQDAAGRWQYLYHERHVRQRELKKFKRLILFAEAVPNMRRVVSHNLRKRDLGRERVMGCILRILSMCFMRGGSHVYADENGSYGLATLRPKHVHVRGDTVEFNFPGKSKVVQHREINDRAVARVVRDLLRHEVPEVFKYQNGNGLFVDVRRRDINRYIREVMGDRFTSKDFRTWAGTLICASALARLGTETAESPAARKRKIVRAIKETAEILGNTPAVCRSSYICPQIIISFERGAVVSRYFENNNGLAHYKGANLHQAEKAVLRLLKHA
jgi:DNA topoisomerase I